MSFWVWLIVWLVVVEIIAGAIVFLNEWLAGRRGDL